MAGRPRSFDRDEALHVALLTFWQHGYDRTSIAMLGAAMGIGTPSLYAAFGDKSTLFDEAARTYVEETSAAQDAALALGAAPAAVQALLDAAADQYTQANTPPGCLVMSEPRLAHHREAGRRALLERLTRAEKDHELPAGLDAAQTASFLDVVISGMAARARDGASRMELGTTIDAVMHLWA